VRGLLLMRVTGGPFAAGRLPENYYGQFIKAAKEGGMAAVCAHEQYQERIEANPATRDRLMAMDPKRYIAVMSNWQDQFVAGVNLPVMGVTEAELRSIAVPTVVIPGNDQTHSSKSGQLAARLIPGSVLHQLPITDQEVPLIPYPEWAPYEDEIARVFVDHMRKLEAQRPRAGQAATTYPSRRRNRRRARPDKVCLFDVVEMQQCCVPFDRCSCCLRCCRQRQWREPPNRLICCWFSPPMSRAASTNPSSSSSAMATSPRSPTSGCSKPSPPAVIDVSRSATWNGRASAPRSL